MGMKHHRKRSSLSPQHGPDGSPLPPYHYTLKHRWAIKLNFLSGITLVPWITLLMRHGHSIDWLMYPHRLLFLSFMAVVNTLLSCFDWLLFSRAVAAQPLHPEPLFILGHPRTGTTHLHNLLSNDPRFAFVTTFHAGFPSSFLSLEPVRGLLSGLLERHRPMDRMALHWDLPAEDEIAVNVLTGGDSPYLALVFPRLWRSLLRNYLTFNESTSRSRSSGCGAAAVPTVTNEAAGQHKGGKAAGYALSANGHREPAGYVLGMAAAEEEEEDPRVAAAFRRWLAAFTWFMKKVTYRYARNNNSSSSGHFSNDLVGDDVRRVPTAPPPSHPLPLLIKSPVHTARLAIWLRLFPRAKFIYVHRNPLEVFQSAANMADTYYWYTYLQRPTDNVTNDFIMDQYEILYRSYMSERCRIPSGQLVEVEFSELDSDPLGVLHRIYHQFGWDEQYDKLVPRFQSYMASLVDFKKNHFNRLCEEAELIVRERWRESFTAFKDYTR